MVDSTHPEHTGALTKWTRCRNVIAGEDAVKAAGVVYLPQLDGQTDPEYQAYKTRALFFNATSRTADSFVGMAFRKPPVESVPDALKPFIEDANLQGQSWNDYEKFILREIINVGRAGSLIEWADEGRPYVCHYGAEQIINWKTRRINGRTVVSLVVLKEEVDANEAEMLRAGKAKEAPADKTSGAKAKAVAVGGYNVRDKTGADSSKARDEFDHDCVKQIRVLKLASETPDAQPVYTVEIWQPIKGEKGEYALVQTITPLRRGIPLNAIPFVFHGPNNLLPCVDRPPLEDIVSINLSHYRSSADLEHGRHFTGLPTAFAAGFDATKEYKIGSTVAWVTTEPNAKAEYLEFTGQGLQALDKALEQKERQMAVLGARMLEQEKRGVETEAVLSMKQTGEQASLAQIVKTASESFELILRWALWWTAAADSQFTETEGQVEVDLNTDFNPADMPPQLITAIIQAVMNGLLSRDSAIECFKRGELVSSTRTVAEEMELIQTEAPKMQGDNKNV